MPIAQNTQHEPPYKHQNKQSICCPQNPTQIQLQNHKNDTQVHKKSKSTLLYVVDTLQDGTITISPKNLQTIQNLVFQTKNKARSMEPHEILNAINLQILKEPYYFGVPKELATHPIRYLFIHNGTTTEDLRVPDHLTLMLPQQKAKFDNGNFQDQHGRQVNIDNIKWTTIPITFTQHKDSNKKQISINIAIPEMALQKQQKNRRPQSAETNINSQEFICYILGPLPNKKLVAISKSQLEETQNIIFEKGQPARLMTIQESLYAIYTQLTNPSQYVFEKIKNKICFHTISDRTQ